MRILFATCLLSVLLPSLAAHAADCGQLQLVNSVQMRRAPGDIDIVPLRINGADQDFILDTGGNTTMINRASAEKLKLRVVPSYRGMVNVAGGAMADTAFIDEFELGRLRGKGLKFPVSPFNSFDGVLSLNFMLPYDVDMDFATDKLNFFSQDHCPGGVQYWKADSVAVVPFTLEDGHIAVSVTVDGQPVTAIIDTGATNTIMRLDIARQRHKLTPGDETTPLMESGPDPDPKAPKLYSHVFRSLAIGAIEVGNPRIGLMEDVWKRDAHRTPLISNRTKTDKDITTLLPELIIGMNILRRTHVYFAFAERKMYISVNPTQ